MQIPSSVFIQQQLTALRVRNWQMEELFSLRWWILISLTAVLVVVWWIFASKRRLLEISLFVFLGAVIFMGISEYGEELTLWDYPTDLIPYFPTLSAVNYFVLPLGFSLLYQRFEQAGAYAAAAAAYSAVVCFIAEPLLSAGGLYRLVHWHYYESLPIYFLVALVVRAAVKRIYGTSENPGRLLKRSM